MFTCFVCKVQQKDCFQLCQHLKFHHGLYPAKKLRLQCGEPGCVLSFCTYNGFRKHLNTVHRRSAYQPVDITQNVTLQRENEEVLSCDFAASDTSQVLPDSSQNVVPEQQLSSMCGSIVAHLQASGVSQSTVQTIVCSMEEVINDVQSRAQETVLTNFSSETTSSDLRKKIEDSFNQLNNPFSELNTEAKRCKYFEQKWEIVEPVECVLGVRLDVRRDSSSRIYSEKPVTDKCMYVPILGTLKSIFKNKDVRESFLEIRQSTNGVYKDISDGSYFQQHALFSQQNHALQILLYYDDFETANPLGSKKGIHKLGCVYFTLKNLLPKYNSVLMNIHLAALFYSADLKTYGFEKILKPLIDDLKILETEGIQLPFFESPLFGSVIQVTGDNLALNGLLGFVESFSGTHFCRFCLVSKDEVQTVFNEDHPKIVLRSKELHTEHCKALNESPTLHSVQGVKKPCVLNSLQFFHSTDNFTVDIMHDLLEGVVQYELKLVFQYFVKNGYVSPSALSDRLQSFSYGFTNRKNKPGNLKIDDNSKHLGWNATQSWCVLRHTPLIFGDVIEQGNSYWNLLLLLIQIVNIVFSPIVTDGIICYLKHLIQDHHNLFKSLFTDRKLIPKHHLMIHYPRCMKKIGPLIHVWCMRFEAKHNFFKRSVKNFKNLTKSLVKQHQRQLAFHYENYSFHRFEFGPVRVKNVCNIEGSDSLQRTLNLVPFSEVSTTSWVKSYGTEYQINLFVCTGMCDELPIFKKICTIVIHGQSAFFIACDVCTLYFDEHLNAYCIEECSNHFSVINVDQITYFKPFDKMFYYGDDREFLVPYCYILKNV